MTMIDTDTFIKSSPFRLTHNDSSSNYNLSNTTPDLLKFQLQEQYRNKLTEMKDSSDSRPNSKLDKSDSHIANSHFLEDSFNSHLQSKLDSGNITLISEHLPSLSSTQSWDSDDFEIDSFILNKSNNPTFLNLKVLIENSILDTSKINKDSILSLGSLKNLKDQIDQKTDLKNYLVSKVSISHQFISTIILKQSEYQETGDDSEDDEDILDAKLLLKVLKSNTSLQDQLLKLNSELDDLTLKLNNHNLACLVLGYVEDVKLSTNFNSNTLATTSSLTSSDPNLQNMSSPLSSPRSVSSPQRKYSPDVLIKQFDSLFSHIASVAVQHNISLPPPPSAEVAESIESRTRWAQQCIDAVLLSNRTAGTANTTVDTSFAASPSSSHSSSHKPDAEKSAAYPASFNDTSFFSSSATLKSNNPIVNERILNEYKTALVDLRFSHQFLTKEYELSRESSMKMIHDYRKKISHLERELTRLKSTNGSNSSSSNSHQDHTNLNVHQLSHSSSASSLNGEYDTVISKDKEISKLRKELNLLKIDKLGIKPSNGSSVQLTSPHMPSESNNRPTSPPPSSLVNNFQHHASVSSTASDLIGVPSEHNHGDEESDDIQSINSVSTRPTSINGYASVGGSLSGGMSNGILRKEFKKIVSDMHDQYDIELSEERIRRRNLQQDFDRLKLKVSDS